MGSRVRLLAKALASILPLCLSIDVRGIDAIPFGLAFKNCSTSYSSSFGVCGLGLLGSGLFTPFVNSSGASGVLSRQFPELK